MNELQDTSKYTPKSNHSSLTSFKIISPILKGTDRSSIERERMDSLGNSIVPNGK